MIKDYQDQKVIKDQRVIKGYQDQREKAGMVEMVMMESRALKEMLVLMETKEIVDDGTKGRTSGGVVYVRWGHDSCPSTGAQLV